MRQDFKKSLLTLDKGLYFHCFMLLTLPLVFIGYGWILAFFYFGVSSFLHLLLLFFYPYIKDSEYYRYQSLRQQFYEETKKHTLPFSYRYFVGAKTTLFVSFYLLLNYPSISSILFPFQLITALVYTSYASVEIVNILARPRLPQSIFKHHPLLQKRYSPMMDIIINKVVPACGKVGGILVSSYVGFVGTYKGLCGVDAIDPLRNYGLNKVYRFPESHTWTESKLSLWTKYCEVPSVATMDPSQKVESFLRIETGLHEFLKKKIDTLIDSSFHSLEEDQRK